MVLRAVSEKGQGMVYKIVNIEKETADDAETAYILLIQMTQLTFII